MKERDELTSRAQVEGCIQTLVRVALQAASEVNMQYSEQAQ